MNSILSVQCMRLAKKARSQVCVVFALLLYGIFSIRPFAYQGWAVASTFSTHVLFVWTIQLAY